MKAMILAAGKGERMGELVASCPKPLLPLGDKSLIERMILALKHNGFNEIIINVFYLAKQIQDKLQDGKKYGVSIKYSVEHELLDTGGGIANALPLLGAAPFLVVSGDIFTDYPFTKLRATREANLAHLVLIDAKSNQQKADFNLENGMVLANENPFYTYANIGVYRADFFCNKKKIFPLGATLKEQIKNKTVSGEIFSGLWRNVNNQKSLEVLRAEFNS